jgi:hypothetical protein
MKELMIMYQIPLQYLPQIETFYYTRVLPFISNQTKPTINPGAPNPIMFIYNWLKDRITNPPDRGIPVYIPPNSSCPFLPEGGTIYIPREYFEEQK